MASTESLLGLSGISGRLTRAARHSLGAFTRPRGSLTEAASALRDRLYLGGIQASSEAFFTLGPDERISAWNPGAEALFGYTAEEAIGRDATIIVPDDRRDEQAANAAKIRREERIVNLETVRMDKVGHRLDVVVNISPIRDEAGRFLGTAVQARDASGRRLAEQMFRLAVESCPSGMVMVDSGGHIVMVNNATELLFGYRRGELLGRAVEILVPDAARKQHAKDTTDYLGTPQRRRMAEERIVLGRRKDGSVFPVDITLNPVPVRNGGLVLAAIVDVSDRKRNERMKNEFVSTVSHELRTPLTSIAGSLALLAGGAAGMLPAPALRLLTIAHKNSERLVRLINDILDIEKIEAGQAVFDFKRVDAVARVEQAIEANRAFAESYGVQVDLDKPGGPLDVRADPDRLLQVVTNLLSNGVKFSPPGGTVTVTISGETDIVRISVRDRGPGIPEDFKTRIYEKFAQADATDAKQKGGTGLGLSIVKQIMLRLGGEVGFKDAPDGGAIFYVAIPRWQQWFETEPTGDRPRVLLCEDDPVAAHALANRVRYAGFTVETRPTAEAAITRAGESEFAAILVDLGLPDSDGISLIQALRALPGHYDTPIVVVSADPERGRQDMRSSNLNILDWLEKPVDIPRMMKVLNRSRRHGWNTRPRILHVDEDAAVLGLVAQALDATADVVSVDSLEGARRALQRQRFDLVVLDVALAADSGLDLLPELRDSDGDPIPVIVFSAQGANKICAARVQQALTKSRSSIDHLISILSKGLEQRRLPEQHREVA